MATNTDTQTPGAAAASGTFRVFRFLLRQAWLNLDRLALVALVGVVLLLPYPVWGQIVLAFLVGAVWATFMEMSPWGRSIQALLVPRRAAERTVRRARASLVASGLGTSQHPVKVSGRALPAGVVLTFKTPKGVPDEAVLDRAAVLASDLRALAVRPLPDTRAGRPRLLVQYSDPLTEELGAPGWVSGPSSTTDLAHLVPFGVAENGETVALNLWGSSLLIGGLPGAGKSVVQRLAVAYAACDPSAILVGADLKPGALELAPMAGRFEAVAASAGDLATVLRQVWAEIHRRAELLGAEGLRKVPTDRRAEFPPVVIVIDEAGQILGDRDGHGADALASLAEILRVGRAFGVTVIAATQHPTAESFGGSTAARSLFAHRICFAVSNASAAEVVLGESPAEAGLMPWTFPSGSGIGVVKDAAAVQPWERLRRFRAYYLDEIDADGILSRAQTFREAFLDVAEVGGAGHLPPAFRGDVAADAERISSGTRKRYRKPRGQVPQ